MMSRTTELLHSTQSAPEPSSKAIQELFGSIGQRLQRLKYLCKIRVWVLHATRLHVQGIEGIEGIAKEHLM